MSLETFLFFWRTSETFLHERPEMLPDELTFRFQLCDSRKPTCEVGFPECWTETVVGSEDQEQTLRINDCHSTPVAAGG